ncbi:MAG: pilus assembly protein PilM [Candidatus Paceibacterota bacterium]|nr:MAG: pilus assembly protein PilM [Candidatus Paceibacterota bacterium]
MFTGLFKKKGSNTVVGIDIGSSAIKVVQLSEKRGKAVLDTYGALALGPYAGVEIGQATNLPADKIISALTEILKESKVSTNASSIAIPFNSTLMTVIELPSASERHLKNIIPIEAKKYVPVPISEVSLDWSILPKDQVESESQTTRNESEKENKEGGAGNDKTEEKAVGEKIKVLIVAIHNDVFGKFKQIIAGAGLESDIFEVEIFSTLRAVLEPTAEPIMIMDVGAASTKLYVVERGNIENSHTINRGSQDITSTISRSLRIPIKEAEIVKRTKGLAFREDKELGGAIFLTLDHIFAETAKVIRNYNAKNNQALNKIILVGGGSSMKGFAEAASANLQVEVLSSDPFSKVEAPVFVSDVLKNTGPEFATAVGVALRYLSEQ